MFTQRIALALFILGVQQFSATAQVPFVPTESGQGESLCHMDNDGSDSLYTSNCFLLDDVQDKASTKTKPDGNFALRVDKNGTGHLRFNSIHSSVTIASTDFFESTKEKCWPDLSLADAEMHWGKPRKQPAWYTFDANSSWFEEPNIYHVDMQFGKEGKISSYRVRGIGITAPAWISVQK